MMLRRYSALGRTSPVALAVALMTITVDIAPGTAMLIGEDAHAFS